jgi:hypothetical protein
MPSSAPYKKIFVSMRSKITTATEAVTGRQRKKKTKDYDITSALAFFMIRTGGFEPQSGLAEFSPQELCKFPGYLREPLRTIFN